MSASTETQGSGNGLEKLKWITVFVLLGLAIWGNYRFSLPDYNIAPVLRIAAVVVVILVAAVIALITNKGKATLTFAKESRTEMRKVIWPTRQETIQTTLIVAAVTAVMSLILWGLDGVMLRLVSFATTLGV